MNIHIRALNSHKQRVVKSNSSLQAQSQRNAPNGVHTNYGTSVFNASPQTSTRQDNQQTVATQDVQDSKPKWLAWLLGALALAGGAALLFSRRGGAGAETAETQVEKDFKERFKDGPINFEIEDEEEKVPLKPQGEIPIDEEDKPSELVPSNLDSQVQPSLCNIQRYSGHRIRLF
ncbi:MAG: hypothetical protein SFU25_04965, partial [Candidatus Caenarcaniphilales bacterium]|nr:hypothetical protein [Candidatus Caenarcaniphilales bacterium]